MDQQPQSLHNTHVKLLAHDLLRLTPNRASDSSFSLRGGGASFSRAETVGTITYVDLVPHKFVKFAVDDGTGCVACIVWLNHLSSSTPFSRRDALTVELTARKAMDLVGEIRIGRVARVRGRIVLYRGAVQITASDVVFERDPNAEIFYWLACIRLMRKCYYPHPILK